MRHVTLMFLILFSINVLLAWLLVWTRRDTWMRHFAVVYLALVMPVFAYAATETLGRHKPAQIAWYELAGQRNIILGYKAVPGSAIYVYVDIGDEEPRAIVLPWDAEKARKLAGSGDPGDGELLIEGTNNWIMDFHVERLPPPRPNPPKPAPGAVPHVQDESYGW